LRKDYQSSFIAALLIPVLVLPVMSAEKPVVSLDIYNRDLAMVRDVRTVSFEKGVQSIDFTGIAEGIYGHTATVTVLAKPQNFTTLELTYHFDLVNQNKLLEKFIGKWFSFSAEDATYQGRLLAMDESNFFLQPDTLDPAIQVVDRKKLTEMFYPGLPEGIFASPTLRWTVDASKAVDDVEVEISYLTTGITWMCDYRGELVDGDSLKLAATFTISNDLKQQFPDAEVALVVGKPHRSEDPKGSSGGDEVSTPGAGKTSEKGDRAEKLGEIYRYKLPRQIDLTGMQTIQTPFFSGRGFKVEKRLEFPHLLDDQVVAARLRFETPSGITGGTPLPEGDIGLYRRTKDGDLAFVGEDFIPITPAGGKIDLTVGQAPDVTARRVRVAQARSDRDMSQDSWQIEVVNGGSIGVTVWAEQRVYGYYKIASTDLNGSSVEPVVEESGRLFFPVKVAANSKSVLKFSINYGY
jgi:hypothetical protein